MADNIRFSEDPAKELSMFLESRNYTKVCVLTDENTHRFCYPLVKTAMPPHAVITIRPGEEHKTINTASHVWKAMTEQAMDRHSVLIVIGGGVPGDLGGFCAVTYKRGIDFILVPTTLLSLVDSSIGGKLGIDFENYKNHIGVFQSPVLTVMNSGFLNSLPEQELRSGFAEVAKHCLISDKAMWMDIIRQPWKNQDWQKVIRHSVELKLRVVTEDPREKGLRKILNAGHTIGHAVESHLLGHGKKVLHGEAIAAGLIMESYLSEKRGMLPGVEAKGVYRYLTDQFGKLSLPENEDDAIVGLMTQDKKNKGNKILCVLLEGIGKARWDCEINTDEVKGALSFYRSY